MSCSYCRDLGSDRTLNWMRAVQVFIGLTQPCDLYDVLLGKTVIIGTACCSDASSRIERRHHMLSLFVALARCYLLTTSVFSTNPRSPIHFHTPTARTRWLNTVGTIPLRNTAFELDSMEFYPDRCLIVGLSYFIRRPLLHILTDNSLSTPS